MNFKNLYWIGLVIFGLLIAFLSLKSGGSGVVENATSLLN
jgi:hypothetical protein